MFSFLARGALLAALVVVAPLAAQDLPPVTDEMLARADAVLHVDAQTGRLAGVTRSGPVAEVGAKILDVLFGDYVAGEWIAYNKRVEGDYVKPAVSQRLVLLGRDGGDWDVATSAHPDEVVARFARTIPTGMAHGTVTVIAGRGAHRHRPENGFWGGIARPVVWAEAIPRIG